MLQKNFSLKYLKTLKGVYGNMDTYVRVDGSKCSHCYKCIKDCTNAHKEKGFLGHLIIQFGKPSYWGDNPRCHHCKIEDYHCSKICPTGAFTIERW